MISTFTNRRGGAIDNGTEYMAEAADVIEKQYPQASPGEQAIAAATLAQAMAIESLAIAVSGQAEDSPLAKALLRYSEGDT